MISMKHGSDLHPVSDWYNCKLYATVMYQWFFYTRWASSFHNLHITCPCAAGGLCLTFFYHDVFFLSCTQSVLSYTSLSPMVILNWLLMKLHLKNFQGCPWDLRTKSSIGCCCSGASKHCCCYNLLCSFIVYGIWCISIIFFVWCIAGKTSNVRDCGNYQWIQESPSVRAHGGVWLHHHLVALFIMV